MGRPEGKKEYRLLVATESSFNYELELMTNSGWRPMPVQPTIQIVIGELHRHTYIYQMMVRIYNIEKEAK